MSYAEAFNYGFLGTSATEVFRAYRHCNIGKIIVCNTGSTSATFDLYHVPKDNTTGSEFALFKSNSIRKNQTIVISDESYLVGLKTGDTLTALSSVADAITMTIYKSLSNPEYDTQVSSIMREADTRLGNANNALRQFGLRGRSFSFGNQYRNNDAQASLYDRQGMSY